MTAAGLAVRRVEDPAVGAAQLITALLAEAVSAKGRATLAVSGGSSPLPMFDALAVADIDWARVDVLQVDERVAPEGHPDRNATALVERLIDPAAVPAGRTHLIDVDGAASPERAAEAYADTLRQLTESARPVIDVVHLGLGSDGHTASLVPGDPVLEVADRDVAATAPYQGRRRVTMAYPLLNRARHRVWLAPGEDKRGAIARLLAGDQRMPAGRVRAEDGVLVTDQPVGGR